ncbi:MAG: hypothetical protein BWY75_02014 [bacterium ADurb.Bin425]|nr:MAG: hypothetical protein BWY75_02014 [bacterium ADurb.Bin425]
MHVFPESKGVFASQLVWPDAALLGAVDDFVVDIGDVAHIDNVITDKAQIALHCVPDYFFAGMTKVTGVIDCGTAGINFHSLTRDRHKVFFLACEGIEYLNFFDF